MRTLRFVLAAAAVLAMAPATGQAQSVSGKFKWVGTGTGTTGSYGWFWQTTGGTNRNVMGGGAYQARFNITPTPSPAWAWPASASGTNNFGATVDIYCVDFLHNAKTSTYNAYFTKLTAASFAGPNFTTRSSDLTVYLKAAYLVDKMGAYGNTTTADKTTRAEIHAAIWHIMSGEPASVYDGTGSTSSTSNYSGAGMNAWIAQANANYGSVNGMEWTVVTDQACQASLGQGHTYADNCSQEFLTRNVVPEPATMILLGTGLLVTLAAAGVFRRPEA